MSRIYRVSPLAFEHLPPNVPFQYGAHFAPPIHTPDITPEGWFVPNPDDPNAIDALMDIAPKTINLVAHALWFDVEYKTGERRRLQFAEVETRCHTDQWDRDDLGTVTPVMMDPSSPTGYIPLDELEVEDSIKKELGDLAVPHWYTRRTDRYATCCNVACVYNCVSVLDTFGRNCRCVFDPEQPNTMLMQTKHKIGDMPLGLICKYGEYDKMECLLVVPTVYEATSGQPVRPLTQEEIEDNFATLNALRRATVKFRDILKCCIDDGNTIALEIRLDNEDRWEHEDALDGYDDTLDGYDDVYDENKYRYAFADVSRDFCWKSWVPHSPRTPEITLDNDSNVEWILNYGVLNNSVLRPVIMDDNGAKKPVTPEMVLASNAPDWLKEKAQRAIARGDKAPDPMVEEMLNLMKTTCYRTATDSVRDAMYIFSSIQDADGRMLAVRDCWAMDADGTPCSSQRDICLIRKESDRPCFICGMGKTLPEELVYYDKYSRTTAISKEGAIALAEACIEEYAGRNIPLDFGHYMRCTADFMDKRNIEVNN